MEGSVEQWGPCRSLLLEGELLGGPDPEFPECPPLIISCTWGLVPGAGSEALTSWKTQGQLLTACLGDVPGLGVAQS